jgi:RNA polymerase-binding transcription factor DksA
MPKEDFLKEQKEKLLKEKKELEKILSGFAKKSKIKKSYNWETKYPQFGEYTTQEDDADEVEEYTNLLPVENRLELKLLDVKRALEKIEKRRSYGFCERCSKKIAIGRLKAMPEAKFCSKCA